MADVKISALPLASTPLTGTEILPIVQSATTDQVTVANLTAGRAVSASSLTLTTTPLAVGSGGTGSNAFTANYIPYSNGTILTSSANFTYNGTSVAMGSALAPNPGGTLQVHGANRVVDANGNLSVFSTDSATVNAGGLLSFGGFNGSGGTFDPWTFANIKGAKENGTSGNFAGYFVISTASSGGVISEKMRINSSGNVGIGTTSPGSRLAVVSATDANPIAYIGGATRGVRIGTTSALSYVEGIDTTGISSYQPLVVGGSDVRFATGGSERMRIDSSGNVGIGTATPGYNLEVSSASITDLASSTTAAAGSAAAYLTIKANASVSSTYYRALRCLDAAGTTSWVVGQWGAPNDTLAFYTGSGITERARIDTSGNLLVGTTVSNARIYGSSGANSPVGRFDATLTSGYTSEVFQAIAGQPSGTGFKVAAFYINNAAAYASYIRGDGTIFAVSTTIQAISDARLKENVRDASEGLNTVLALKPRRFDWKEGKGSGKKNQIGFIAQEVETVFPDAIDVWDEPNDDTEYKSVGSSLLIPVLVKAIQELAAKVAELEAKI
jgi:hypothetical protein